MRRYFRIGAVGVAALLISGAGLLVSGVALLLSGWVLIPGSSMQAQAQTQTQNQTQPDQPAAQPGQGRGAGRGGFGGGAMGQRVQGTVTTAAADKLTLQTEAGDSYEVTVTSTSRILRDRQPIKFSDVKPGDSVTAMGAVDAAKKTVQAMMVNDVDAATIARAKDNLGKTYITGRITAIDADNLKLTVLRADQVSQVIQVDDGTSFQRGMRGVQADVAAAGGMGGGGAFGGGMGAGGRGGQQAAATPPPESITLADIKVGDAVMATGTMKGGVFTPVKMGISEADPGGAAGQGAGARGAGRRSAQGAPPPPAGSDAPGSPPSPQ